MARNGSIEFLRVVFMGILVLWHYQSSAGLVTHGYLAVDFFFFLSGFFLYGSTTKGAGVIHYSISRFKRFLPLSIITVLGAAIIRFEHYKPFIFSLDYFYENIVGLIPQCLLIHRVGMFSLFNVNGPLWYISVLLFGGGCPRTLT